MMASKIPHWRAAADPDVLREYDAFGPWIGEVKHRADLPRRFSRWWPELQGARHLLKVPRSLDRAKVRPGMDLYETVIAVFPDRVRVLRADPADITSREAPRDVIVATVLHTNLLVARWTLLLADGGTVEVEYNAVSHPTIAEVNRYVLSREWAAPASSAEVTIPPVTSPPGFTELVITAGRAVITQPVLAAPDTVADLLTAHGDARTPSTGS